jgi:hypothetical protein
MVTIARVSSREVPARSTELATLKAIGLFCAAGLFVSLLMAAYGLDLSPGFF